MSNRTVVSVEARGDDTIEIKLAKSPGAIPNARDEPWKANAEARSPR